MIKIVNDGKALKCTNYWDTEHAKKGYFYLSWNAGAARLLVPKSQENQIKEMKAALYVVISRGKFQGRDALELMFEDNTDAPYSIHLVTEQCDRLLPEADQGSGFTVDIWTRDGLKASFDGKYRVVNTLPCLNAWVNH
jgi:hypothetical protein